MANWKRWSTRWGQLAVVVVMMLAAIGAWEIVKGMARLGGYAHADGVVADHLTCYELEGVAFDPKTPVRLQDQFSTPTTQVTIDATVRQLRLLCTPAVKTVVTR